MGFLTALLFSRGGLLLMALAGAWFWHAHDKSAAIEAHDKAATEQRRAEVAEFVVAMSGRETAARAANAARAEQVRIETRTLIEKVPEYVTTAADARCIIPAGFVRHYDAAWSLSPLPAAAGGSVDEPSGFPLSRVESSITDNAGSAKQWRAESLAWRDWYARNKSAFDAFAQKSARRTP